MLYSRFKFKKAKAKDYSAKRTNKTKMENKLIETFSDSALLENSGQEKNIYRQNGKFCDFELKFANTGTEVVGNAEDGIKVHKIILASACPYFRALFDSNMSECEKGYLEFGDDVTKVQLKTIIEYLYTGEIDIEISTAESYFQQAIYFGLESLADFCAKILIEDIKCENCLYLWRLGEKVRNQHLKTKAIDFILENVDVFLDDELFLELTGNEVEILIADDKIACSEEKIFSFVMKWLYHDTENRKKIFKTLIKDIRFPLITAKYMASEVLTNDILLENNEFLNIAAKILKLKLDPDERASLKFDVINLPRIGLCERNIVFVLNKTIYHSNFKETSSTSTKSIGHAPVKITTFAKNYLLLSGGENTRNCSYYCPVRLIVKPFPPMREQRKKHGIVTLSGKIYCCGGSYNQNSVEVFDIGAGIWYKGSSINNGRHDCGITTWDNCVYVMGGSMTTNSLNILERYDPREHKWSILPDYDKIVNESYVRTCAYNDALYGFTQKSGYVFDIKANKWMEQAICAPPTTWQIFDLTNIEEMVYVISKMHTIQPFGGARASYGGYTYDIVNDTWAQSKSLDIFDSVSMTTMFT